MKKLVTRVLALCLVVAAPLTLAAATVELKDGTTVTGTVEGKVVLGGRLDEKKPGDRKFVPGGIFFLVPGKEIVSITKSGVETAKGAQTPWALFAGRKLPPTPQVLDIVEKLGDMATFGAAMEKGLSLGMAQFSNAYDKSPIGVALMGEYSAENGGSLTPALRITTESGLRTIDIADVIDYVTAPKP
jgi:hypothetical protein